MLFTSSPGGRGPKFADGPGLGRWHSCGSDQRNPRRSRRSRHTIAGRDARLRRAHSAHDRHTGADGSDLSVHGVRNPAVPCRAASPRRKLGNNTDLVCRRKSYFRSMNIIASSPKTAIGGSRDVAAHAIAVLVLSVGAAAVGLAATSAVAGAEPRQETSPTDLDQQCAEKGGTYSMNWPKNYSCTYLDGSTTTCEYGSQVCTDTPPPPPPLRGPGVPTQGLPGANAPDAQPTPGSKVPLKPPTVGSTG